MAGNNKQKFYFLFNKLYPNGRAFRIQHGTDSEDLHNVAAEVLGESLTDVEELTDHILPDNANYTEADADIWEPRLGIISNPGVSLADRKAGILEKWNYPGEEYYRQDRAFIEGQLRLAGFDVYVYDNRWDDGSGGYYSKSPAELLGVAAGSCILDEFELDDVELDGDYSDAGITLCVNYLEEEIDAVFSFVDNYDCTFIIAGSSIDLFADVDEKRKYQFRQLILQLKQQQAAAILFVNYV